MTPIQIPTKTPTQIPTAPTPPTSTPADQLAAMLAESAPCAGALDKLAFGQLSTNGLIDTAVAWEKLARHAHAGLIRSLGALVHIAAGERGVEQRLIEAEVTAALAWSPSAAQNRLREAEVLVDLFPQTVQQLSEARVSVEQTRALAQLTFGLDEQAAQAVEARVLPRMPDQTVAVTRQAIRRAVLRADPDAAAQRHRYERARRRVELIPEEDGMATLNFYLPADIAQMAMRTLTDLAQTAKRKNKNSSDKRTLDQRRADLLPALLQSATGAGTAVNAGAASVCAAFPVIPASVNVVVNIETLLGLSHEPGHIDGYGPICPEQTRRIAHAHASRWRFLLTSSDGTPVQASQRTYTPRAAVKRLTQLKYPTCTFPHCRMPAERCDIDHGLPFHRGGPTSVSNLGPICRMHHNSKSFGNWSFDRQGDTILWTSNLTGRSYATEPARYPVAQTA